MYSNPGLIPVWVRRGDVREEEGVAARFQHRDKGGGESRCISVRLSGPV